MAHECSTCHNPLLRSLMCLAWLLTALGAIHLGLTGLGYNIWNTPFIQNNLAWLVQPAHWAIGLAGVVSLVAWFMKLGHKCK